MNYILVAVGSALGGAARFGASGLVARWVGETFPFGTLFVNVTGSFIIGFIATISGPDGRWMISGNARNFLTAGFCGGYTTFSSFSLQTLSLAEDREWLYVSANIIGSVLLCLFSVWLGHTVAAKVNTLR